MSGWLVYYWIGISDKWISFRGNEWGRRLHWKISLLGGFYNCKHTIALVIKPAAVDFFPPIGNFIICFLIRQNCILGFTKLISSEKKQDFISIKWNTKTFSTISSCLAARYQPHTEALYKKWVYKLNQGHYFWPAITSQQSYCGKKKAWRSPLGIFTVDPPSGHLTPGSLWHFLVQKRLMTQTLLRFLHS